MRTTPARVAPDRSALPELDPTRMARGAGSDILLALHEWYRRHGTPWDAERQIAQLRRQAHTAVDASLDIALEQLRAGWYPTTREALRVVQGGAR